MAGSGAATWLAMVSFARPASHVTVLLAMVPGVRPPSDLVARVRC